MSPLHSLSSWNVSRAEQIGRRLIAAGVDINTQAKRGPTVGGTPLMWSVFGNHLDHTSILLQLGADPMASIEGEDDSISFATRLHLASHLRRLLENVLPARIRRHIRRLIEEAASDESRFTRMKRHGEVWKTVVIDTLQLLRDWNDLYPDSKDFGALILPALDNSLRSPFCRMNTDVQLALIESAIVGESNLSHLSCGSVLIFNTELFDGLLDYGVSVINIFDRKESALHLYAKISDHSLTATAFAPRLLNLGVALDSPDEDGVTSWMDAILERKWDLADFLMKRGA